MIFFKVKQIIPTIDILKIDKMVVSMVYVDDIILTGNDEIGVNNLKKILAKNQRHGNFGVFLSDKIRHVKIKTSFSDKGNTIDLLEETCLLGCRATQIRTSLSGVGICFLMFSLLYSFVDIIL